MLNEERRGKIIELVQEHGQVRVGELSRRFRISEVTIRNDLRKLQSRGLVQRAHGGAVRAGLVAADPALHEKAKLHMAEKRRIAVAAAALIEDGDTIILDSGSTTQEIAREIKGRRKLQVITNGINVALELAGARGIQLILLGGVVRENSYSVVGRFAERMVADLSADKLFLAADACDLTTGLTTPNIDEAHVNEAMVRSARETILVADSSKFGRRSLSRIVGLTEVNRIITDDALPPPIRAALERLDLELTIV